MVLTQAASTPMMDRPWLSTPMIRGADHGAGDGADAAGDGRAADEAGRDGVHLELMPGLSR